MIDIHTHIMPSVDDGSENVEKSIAMLEQAKSQGVTHIILTPHAITQSSTYINKEDMKQRFEKFVEAVKHIGIKLYLGSEIFYNDKTYRKLADGELLTFNDSKYCLIEFSMHERDDLDEILFNIHAKGFKPILAHPERYSYLDIECVEELRESALIQVNTTSILGMNGKKIQKFVFKLMKADLIDFISSDCHDTSDRSVNLHETYLFVKKKMGEKYAHKIFYENTQKLIEAIENNS